MLVLPNEPLLASAVHSPPCHPAMAPSHPRYTLPSFFSLFSSVTFFLLCSDILIFTKKKTMGQKVSHEKANVVVSLRAGMSRPDTLKVSYRGGGCLRRRRPIAFFTFPSTGWRCAEGIEACEAEGGLSVPLDALKYKDLSKIIQLRCGSGGRTLLKAAMPLGMFLNNLDYLHFSLHSDGRGSSGAYTVMRCNGHPCLMAARPPMWHRPNGGKEASAPTRASVTPAGGAGGITKASNTKAGDATHITKASNTKAGDVTHITKASNTKAGDVTHITKASHTKAGDVTHITKASHTKAGDVTHITKASNTKAGDATHITKASHTKAGDVTHITKASNTKAGDVTHITKASHTKAGDVTHITKASHTRAGDVTHITKASHTKAGDGTHITKASHTPGSPHHTLRRRKTKKPNLRAHGRDTATPKRHDAPYTWTDVFVDVTAICAAVLSGVLAYYTR
ncbi:uncharacterized protein LOC126990284 isoform X9 [Eriocheir sinensis]|uniref:uncharacterized protein LOC126990284 isoform X9 n=1 Tax=Eriocheir sinensis TaxID=95602 RepID=UPI0021C7889B|nr:uncharacterized protein LOC126990284 isoform X9 [Eriocheir sinensis]